MMLVTRFMFIFRMYVLDHRMKGTVLDVIHSDLVNPLGAQAVVSTMTKTARSAQFVSTINEARSEYAIAGRSC
jgi:hypothetical protein